MLIRGGLDARRVEHIEGFADRRPKNPSDPAAAENRRIELLIRAPLP
jgi:chemotaxis protein MotB